MFFQHPLLPLAEISGPARDISFGNLETVLLVTAGGVATGTQYMEARVAAKPPAMHGTAPPPPEFPNPKCIALLLRNPALNGIVCSMRRPQ